jgi:hypothetical protein
VIATTTSHKQNLPSSACEDSSGPEFLQPRND